ncbi:MAG: hypothetical protein ACTSR1_00130 [Candidatus Heimdallarchaeota archaeon]
MKDKLEGKKALKDVKENGRALRLVKNQTDEICLAAEDNKL